MLIAQVLGDGPGLGLGFSSHAPPSFPPSLLPLFFLSKLLQ